MTAKRALTTVTLLILCLLTACTSTKSSSSKQPTRTETTSNSTTKTPADKATINPYHIPNKDRQNPKFQKSGLLQVPGQFSYDQAGTKLTLKKTQALAKTASRTGFKITVTAVKVIFNQAKTNQAKQMAEQAFSIAKLPNPYQTIQLRFKMTNLRGQTILTDGVKTVKLSDGAQVSSTGGLSDASAGKPIPAKTSRTFTAMILAGPTTHQIDQLTIQFSGSFTQTGAALSPAPAPISITLS